MTLFKGELLLQELWTHAGAGVCAFPFTVHVYTQKKRVYSSSMSITTIIIWI
jgi:hypothetical protein